MAGFCETGWLSYNNCCYFASDEKKNYAGALDDCRSRGADLASIHDDAEQQFVVSIGYEAILSCSSILSPLHQHCYLYRNL